MEFSLEEKKILIRLARLRIEEKLFDIEKVDEFDIEKYPNVKSKCGAFVTLTMNGELRGCIGYITSDDPLHQTIQEAAEHAAFEDPRFYPLTEEEYNNVEIEISVLSEAFPMKSYDEIELGKHGLILEESGRRGLLLPQVPVEHGMDKEQFLNAICRKTGVPQDLWRKKLLNLSLFSALVFCEKDLEE